MSSHIKLKERHKEAYKRLMEAVDKKRAKGKDTQIACKIGLSLDISGQTVINYCNGKGKDGFLIEALTQEYRKYKIQ